MRSSVWLLISYCMVVLSAIACGDSSGPSTISPANVALISGDAQPTPEVGTKLPLPLTIKVSDAQGNSVAGVAVARSVVPNLRNVLAFSSYVRDEEIASREAADIATAT